MGATLIPLVRYFAPIVLGSAQRDDVRAGLPVDEHYADAFTSPADKTTTSIART